MDDSGWDPAPSDAMWGGTVMKSVDEAEAEAGEVCVDVKSPSWATRGGGVYPRYHSPTNAAVTYLADVAAAHDQSACRRVLLHGPSERLLGLAAEPVDLVEDEDLEPLLA